MPKLIVNPGSKQAWEFELRSGENRLGSNPANDCVIEDFSVSGFHARVEVADEQVSVIDLGSSNGTFIDREPVAEAVLQPGQMLRLGGVELLLSDEAIEPQPVPVPGLMLKSKPVVVKVVEPAPMLVSTVESASTTPGAPVVRLRIPRPAPPPEPVSAAVQAAKVPAVSEPPAVRPAPPVPPPIPVRAEPPLPPSIPIAAESAAAMVASPYCKFHPKTLATWFCPRCGRSYCELCVSSRRVDDVLRFFCRPCGEVCSEIEPFAEEDMPEPSGFATRIPGAFAYPFKNDGVMLLAVGTGIFTVVAWLQQIRFLPLAGLILGAIATGYTFLYMQNIITRTATDDERKADLPDMEGIFEPFFAMVGTVVLCFGPAFGMLVWYLMDREPAVWWGCIATSILCGLYFPMAFLAVAMFDSVVAVNPVVVLPAIFKVPFQYLLATVLFGIVLVASSVGQRYLKEYLPIPIVPTIICSFVSLYCLTVQSRILGLLYYTNYERIGWLR